MKWRENEYVELLVLPDFIRTISIFICEVEACGTQDLEEPPGDIDYGMLGPDFMSPVFCHCVTLIG